MQRVRRALGALLTAGGLVVMLAAPALASSHDEPNGHAQAGAVWGDPCGRVNATANGGRLVCVQGQHDDCPRWHSATPGKPGTGWVQPSTPPCPLCSPSASPAASPSTSTSPSPSASTSTSTAAPSSPAAHSSTSTAAAPSSPAGATVCATSSPADSGDGMLETPAAGACGAAGVGGLPVTGAPVAGLVLAGLVLAGAGGLLVRSGRAGVAR